MIRASFLVLFLYAALMSPGCAAAPIRAGIVREKIEAIEPRFMWTFFEGPKYPSRSVYYLVAKDGSRCEVDLDTFLRVHPGDIHTSAAWAK